MCNMLKILILDNEKNCRKDLECMLLKKSIDVDIIGSSDNLEDARTIIEHSPIDLLFLDVMIGNQSGFDLLNSLKLIPFATIFTTAYEEYAVKAFKYSALDYLLKPIVEKELYTALKKAQ